MRVLAVVAMALTLAPGLKPQQPGPIATGALVGADILSIVIPHG